MLGDDQFIDIDIELSNCVGQVHNRLIDAAPAELELGPNSFNLKIPGSFIFLNDTHVVLTKIPYVMSSKRMENIIELQVVKKGSPITKSIKESKVHIGACIGVPIQWAYTDAQIVAFCQSTSRLRYFQRKKMLENAGNLALTRGLKVYITKDAPKIDGMTLVELRIPNSDLGKKTVRAEGINVLKNLFKMVLRQMSLLNFISINM